MSVYKHGDFYNTKVEFKYDSGAFITLNPFHRNSFQILVFQT